MQEQMQQQQTLMQQQQSLLLQQQNRIQQLETSTSEQDGKVVYKNPRATTLKLYEELLEEYPAIGEPKFFDSELPKNHDVFNWNDFHYTEGMDYKPPPVLQHSEVSLPGPAKRHENDLATIQGYLAHTTRSTTLAPTRSSTLENPTRQSASVCSVSSTLISRMRENLYLDELGIKHGNDKEESLFTLDSLAARKAAADLVRKTYKKYEPPKDKTKKYDNKSSKDKSGTGDKPKDQQSGKSQSKD
ncbi:hypothetical protein BGZ79_005834, partial [Entomortierella chlamydospora]